MMNCSPNGNTSFNKTSIRDSLVVSLTTVLLVKALGMIGENSGDAENYDFGKHN